MIAKTLWLPKSGVFGLNRVQQGNPFGKNYFKQQCYPINKDIGVYLLWDRGETEIDQKIRNGNQQFSEHKFRLIRGAIKRS